MKEEARGADWLMLQDGRDAPLSSHRSNMADGISDFLTLLTANYS